MSRASVLQAYARAAQFADLNVSPASRAAIYFPAKHTKLTWGAQRRNAKQRKRSR